MRLVFLGTSEFACPALRELVRAGHDIAAVVTAPSRRGGRGKKPLRSPVEQAAGEIGLPLLRPEDPNSEDFVRELSGLGPELGILVSYGHILHEKLMSVPPRGFLNLHPSLLPAYRGAAPIQRALMDGVGTTGVCVIQMARKVDAGDILARRAASVGPDDTAGELSDRLAELGAGLLVDTIGKIGRDEVSGEQQDTAAVTRAPKLTEKDRILDWTLPADALHNRIRALSPSPGAWTLFRGERLLVYRSRPAAGPTPAPPGTILSDRTGLWVATGSGILELLQVKPQGSKVQDGRSFVNGRRPESNEKLETGGT
ncbi:MAG: methionyl-tRNA formyltransferase [candidate division WOR-3 bacterium]|nr:MAG: methionyl-tRNA formyltransferase [candidate division WOR-3 bacterium]